MEQSRRPDLTVSIISADNLDLLLPCLCSVFENAHHISLEVYVVDNASTDGTAEAVQAKFPQVKIVHNETRLGFSTNNNMVLRQGHGRYLMLLNDDTLVLDKSLDRMVEFMDVHPQAGVVGSSLLNPDGSFQPAFAFFPHPLIEALMPVTNWSHRVIQHNDCAFSEVDSVCGASMLVRREVIEQVGLLDTAFDPIYSEEVDWCYRIKKAGWKLYTLPQAQIIHHGSQTMNRAVPRKYELLLSHKLLFFRKHKGAVAANVYRVALGISTIFKLLWWVLISLFRPGDRNSADRKRLHWYILKRIPSL